MHNKIFNKPTQKPIRQTLRSTLPVPEQLLWQRLRNKQLGVKFRRQQGIGRYIVDFYCPECALVIEVDGDSHYSDDAEAYDAIRDEFMAGLKIHALRFTNKDVMTNIDAVLLSINQAIQSK